MSAGGVPGAAGVVRVLDQDAERMIFDHRRWRGRPPRLGRHAETPPGRGGLATRAALAALLAAVLPDPVAVAAALLDRFGCLGAVLAASEEKLVLTPGVTDAAAALLVAAHGAAAVALAERFERDVVGNWPALEDWLRLNLGGLPAGWLVALFLDRKDGLIRAELLGEGTADRVLLHAREVACRALL